MIIGVISDTHDKLETIERALKYFNDRTVEYIVHCGDWKNISTMMYFAELAAQLSLPVRAVLGNRDEDVSAFTSYAVGTPGDFILIEDIISLDEGKVIAVHGHHLPTLKKVMKDESVRIVLRGHSHKPLIEKQDDKLIVNPGSTAFSIPRSKQWRPSVAIVDTDKGSAELVYLD